MIGFKNVNVGLRGLSLAEEGGGGDFGLASQWKLPDDISANM